MRGSGGRETEGKINDDYITQGQTEGHRNTSGSGILNLSQ